MGPQRLISGHRIGIGPGIVFFARELLWPFAAEANYVVLASAYAIVVITSALMIYPYFQDLYNVNEALKVANRSDYFVEKHCALMMSRIAMLLYAIMIVLLFSEGVTNRVADYLTILALLQKLEYTPAVFQEIAKQPSLPTKQWPIWADWAMEGAGEIHCGSGEA
uniref:Uncharacterized protein n=1 Tax=Parascaris equorum TaxID=6256 RepID=A0A914R4C5_PAREQ